MVQYVFGYCDDDDDDDDDVGEELYFHELYARSRPGDDESESQSRYRQVCQTLSTCCYVSVLMALATDDVTIVNEWLSANDVRALALALEVTSLTNISEYLSLIHI